MQQSRLSSFYEACMNIVIGFTINFFANLVLIPLFLGVEVPLLANWWMGCAYTVVSLIRSYVIRRWFNARLHAAAMRLAGQR
jgi:membrane protein implicated in regulation of membrane protease activity